MQDPPSRADLRPGGTAAWTARITHGDRAAFAAFYDAWFDRSLAVARRILRNDRDGAYDVVQDVMLRIARSMPALADERAVESWMARAIFRASIDRLRAEARRVRRECAGASGEAGPDALTRLELDERVSWLREQLAALPESDRRAVLLRYSGDGTLEDVGRALGITGDAAHGRIRRAIARLRRKAMEVFGDDCT